MPCNNTGVMRPVVFDWIGETLQVYVYSKVVSLDNFWSHFEHFGGKNSEIKRAAIVQAW